MTLKGFAAYRSLLPDPVHIPRFLSTFSQPAWIRIDQSIRRTDWPPVSLTDHLPVSQIGLFRTWKFSNDGETNIKHIDGRVIKSWMNGSQKRYRNRHTKAGRQINRQIHSSTEKELNQIRHINTGFTELDRSSLIPGSWIFPPRCWRSRHRDRNILKIWNTDLERSLLFIQNRGRGTYTGSLTIFLFRKTTKIKLQDW